jgi:hypothetical protein
MTSAVAYNFLPKPSDVVYVMIRSLDALKLCKQSRLQGPTHVAKNGTGKVGRLSARPAESMIHVHTC